MRGGSCDSDVVRMLASLEAMRANAETTESRRMRTPSLASFAIFSCRTCSASFWSLRGPPTARDPCASSADLACSRVYALWPPGIVPAGVTLTRALRRVGLETCSFSVKTCSP
jgi:hypothetical protein